MLDAALFERDGKPVNNVRLRTYRLDDLTEVRLTDEGFAIDPGFEPDDPIYAGRTVCIVQNAAEGAVSPVRTRLYRMHFGPEGQGASSRSIATLPGRQSVSP